MPTTAVLTCSFCGRPQHRVAKLIMGPSAVGICADCVALARRAVDAAAAVSDARTSMAPAGSGACSFCGKREGEGAPPVRLAADGAGSTRVCDECLDLCEEILADESAR